MNKVTTNQKTPEKENPATIPNSEVKEKKTCEGCGESIFCELSTFNDRRCENAVSEK